MSTVMRRAFCGRCGRTLVEMLNAPRKSYVRVVACPPARPVLTVRVQQALLQEPMLAHFFETQHHAYAEAVAVEHRASEAAAAAAREAAAEVCL
jgi:hypothetical protein